MKLSKSLHTPTATDIGTGLQWQHASVNNIAGVTNSTFTPSTPRLGTNSRNVIPRIENGEWLVARQDSWSSLDSSPVEQPLEQARSPLVFHPVTDEAHKTKSRSRLKNFIHHLFHPMKYLARRKAEKAAENIKVMLADPDILLKKNGHEALNETLNKALLREAAKFLSAVKTLRPKTAVSDTPQYRALNELLMKKFPMGMLLNPELTGKWHTLLPDFANFAQDFRLRVTPCTDLAIEFEDEVTKCPEKHLFECVPDWSTRFDEKATTARENAHGGLLPRLEEYLSKAKQYLQDMDPVVTRL